MIRPGNLGWILVALLIAAPEACAGDVVIRGTLRLPGQSVKPPNTVSTSAGRVGRRGPARNPAMDAVIYLDSIPEKLEKKLAKKSTEVRIAQYYGQFIPRVTPVAAGTTVEFENQDRVYHSAFSVSPAKKFDVGKYAPRESRRVKFDRPGLVRVFCDIDPEEFGYVLVLPHHAFTQPDSTGAFSFPKVPRGAYTIKVWHPNYNRLSRNIETPKKGDLSLDLRF